MNQGSLQFPGASSSQTTIAEWAMVSLAEDWHQAVDELPANARLNNEIDKISYAALQLAVEWGNALSSPARRAIRANIRLVGKRDIGVWHDELVWKLCLASMLKAPSRSDAVDRLIMNLDHPKSSLRLMMLKLGWITRGWLKNADFHLLNNLALSHVYSDLALALCMEVLSGEDPKAQCREFRSPDDRQRHYDQNLEKYFSEGLQGAYMHFWKLEAACRKHITDVSMRDTS